MDRSVLILLGGIFLPFAIISTAIYLPEYWECIKSGQSSQEAFVQYDQAMAVFSEVKLWMSDADITDIIGVEALVTALKDEDSDMQTLAEDAISKLGNDLAFDGLAIALQNKNVDVEYGAIVSLKKSRRTL